MATPSRRGRGIHSPVSLSNTTTYSVPRIEPRKRLPRLEERPGNDLCKIPHPNV